MVTIAVTSGLFVADATVVILLWHIIVLIGAAALNILALLPLLGMD